MLEGKKLTASNLLSLSRIASLAPILYYLHLGNTQPDYNLIALIIMFVSALTDTFDGWLARRLNQVTEFGKVIDPVADKIAVAVIPGYLAFTRPDFPMWFFIAAIARDVLIFSVGLYAKNKYNYLFTSNFLGKLTVTVIALMVFVFVVKDFFLIEFLYRVLLWSSAALLMASFISYALRFKKFIHQLNSTAS